MCTRAGSLQELRKAGRLLTKVGNLPVVVFWSSWATTAARTKRIFAHLVPYVGSFDALWRLDVVPVPDEAFDWSAVEDRDRSFVEEVLRLSDECCKLVHDVEFRTIARRILARVRRARPSTLPSQSPRCPLRRVARAGSSRDSSGALGWGRRRSASWIWSWFGVGNCSDRGRSLRRAARLEPDGGWLDQPLSLGDPALLHSSSRCHAHDPARPRARRRGRRRTWSMVDGNDLAARVEVRMHPTKVVSAVKGVLTDTGRATVVVGFGERVDDAYYVSLTVPDAHELVRQVQPRSTPRCRAEIGVAHRTGVRVEWW